MAFDIRGIFTRSLGGHSLREAPLPEPSPDEATDDELPDSPIAAASTTAASPETGDMTQGGATASTALIPEGLDAIPTAAIDTTSTSRDDDAVDALQAARVAEVAIAAAIVHDELSDAGYAELLESLNEVPGLEALDRDDVDAIVARLGDAADGETAADFEGYLEDRVLEIAEDLRDPSLRRAAYQLAVYFCAWDAPLTDEETDLLEALAEAFELPGLEARALREATMIEAGVESLPVDRAERISLQ